MQQRPSHYWLPLRCHSEVGRCLVRVNIVSKDTQSMLYRKMRYDKKHMGRTMIIDVPECGLTVGDRLIPNGVLMDVSDFETTPCPFEAHFWRITKDSRLMYPSPMMNIEGFGVENYCVDLLHSWHLGPLQNYIGAVFWFMIESSVWKPEIAWLCKEQQYRLSMLRLKSEMWAYHEDRRRNDSHWAASGSKVVHISSRLSQFNNTCTWE